MFCFDKELTENMKSFTMKDLRALRDLILLLEENESAPVTDDLYISPHIEINPPNFRLNPRDSPIWLNPHVWAFLMAEISDIKRTCFSPVIKNLSKLQAEGLKTLSNRLNVVIKPVDKGGNVVVMLQPHYERMCL